VDKDSTVRIDITDHGTRAVTLVFKVFDRADVYVGRVFRLSKEDDNTRDLMATVGPINSKDILLSFRNPEC